MNPCGQTQNWKVKLETVKWSYETDKSRIRYYDTLFLKQLNGDYLIRDDRYDNGVSIVVWDRESLLHGKGKQQIMFKKLLKAVLSEKQ